MNSSPLGFSLKSEQRLDLLRMGLLRSRGVVLRHACFMDLIEQLHGCRMTREDTNVNMRR